jgi:hypothetical protein
MSESQETWTQSQKDAWSYVRKGVGEGLSGRAALRQYREGGGHIGNANWFSLYKTAFNIEGWKETIQEIPRTYNIREEMFTDIDVDYRSEFILQAKVSGYSEELSMRITKWVTVESDKILTKQEWLWGMQQAVDSSLGSPVFLIDQRIEYSALHRARNP